MWVPASTSAITLGAVRKLKPTVRADFSTALLEHAFLQGFQTQSMKEMAKWVRKDQGVLHVSIHPTSLGACIHTLPNNVANQAKHLMALLSKHEVTESEYQRFQPRVTDNLQTSFQNAQTRMRLTQPLSLFPQFLPYLHEQNNFVLDTGTLSFAEFVQHQSTMQAWPVAFFLYGGDQDCFHQMIQTLSNFSTQNKSIEDVSFQEAILTRQLCDDPEASHYMGFRTQFQDHTQRYFFDLLKALLQNPWEKEQIKLLDLHGQTQSVFGFEKKLNITQIPEHMEWVWKQLLEVRHNVPAKQDLQQAIYFAKTNILRSFESPESVLSFAMKEKMDAGYTDYVSQFSSLDTPVWMNFVEELFDFDKQWILEVVPQMYGMGASSDLRLESLKKRINWKKEEKQNHLADQYQFADLHIDRKTLQENQFAQTLSINPQHSVMLNQIATQNLAHLTVYFEGGRRFEHEKNAGITQLLCMSILHGSQEKTYLVNQLKAKGISIEIENTADFFGFHFTMHPSLVDSFIPTITSLIYDTGFSEGFVNHQKIQLLKELTDKEKDPFFRSVELFYRSLFGVHGYGQPRLGQASSVLYVQMVDLEEHYRQHILDASTLWVLTSPCKHENLPVLISKLVSTQTKSNENRAQLFSLSPKRKMQIFQDPQAGPIRSVCMGLKTVSVKDKRQYFLDIIQIYLSGSGGKLSDALVEKLNLVDTVKAYHVHLLQAGAFFIQLKSAQTQDASLFEYLQTIFTSMTTVLPSNEALENAKNLAILRKKQQLLSPFELSYDMGSRHFAGLSWDHPLEIESKIKKTTPSEITHILSELMDYDTFAMGMC